MIVKITLSKEHLFSKSKKWPFNYEITLCFIRQLFLGDKPLSGKLLKPLLSSNFLITYYLVYFY